MSYGTIYHTHIGISDESFRVFDETIAGLVILGLLSDEEYDMLWDVAFEELRFWRCN